MSYEPFEVIMRPLAAGVRCVGCEWGFHSKDQLLEAGAAIIIQQPTQILEWIDGVNFGRFRQHLDSNNL
jgi:hypothetical protein